MSKPFSISNKPFSISLKAGEKIFVNGAVLRVDRKVSIEFLNDVAFLLEAHVMQPEKTTTPLRQLYFIVQTMLMDPANAHVAKQHFEAAYYPVFDALPLRHELRRALSDIRQSVQANRYYEALKTLRGCFAIEDAIIGNANLAGAQQCR
jgi:flagellar biosynthesis repressor protein FlbT